METPQNKTWDSGVGIVSETHGQTGAGIKRTVINPKTYSTHNRARKYGQSRDPAPITMLDGSERWTPLPFWRHDGVIYLYKEAKA
jgi:hypothetical protein